MFFCKRAGSIRRWRTCCRRTNVTAALVCGVVLLLSCSMVRGICGGPWGTRGALQLGERLPSVVWMTLFWSMWHFLLGTIFGVVIFSERFCGVVDFRAIAKYRGTAYFVCMVLLGFLWYPLFFLAARFALCALLSAVLTYLAIAAGFNYAKVVPAAGIVLGLYAIVLLIATICGVRLLFHT